MVKKDRLSSDVSRDFITMMGSHGERHGLSRAGGQIVRLLFLADRPLNTDEITEEIGAARSTIASAIKELLGSGLIRSVSIRGKRPEHYSVRFTRTAEYLKMLYSNELNRDVVPLVSQLERIVGSCPKSDGDLLPKFKDALSASLLVQNWLEMIGSLSQDEFEKYLSLKRSDLF